MDLKVKQNYYGFSLEEEKKISEINSVARLFIHEKSGARLFHLENDDDNKVFCISFRTPPHDNTGAPHILEHSVLCGSRKYPIKEPFIELAKGSLNTFLNAMTFADKTMYPIASRNEKDFYNLMDVYMDAVFYPNIYDYPETLMQEGWHYDLLHKDEEITFKGVVYNEMQGAFSAPESILMRKIQETLFPDTPYRYESGGDPDYITDLTQEQFLKFHKKYYHPSNSYIFLYGDGDLMKQLEYLNNSYLKNFDRLDIDSHIPMQQAFLKQQAETLEYPIALDEDEKDKTYFSLNYVVGQATDPELYLAFEILEHLLLGTPAAPLKKALIEADLGKDVFGQFDNSILQPVFSIVIKHTNEEQKVKFLNVVDETLKKLVNEGIDKKLIEASININEFQLREADFRSYPKGLIYNIKCLDSWLYDHDPKIHLEYEPSLAKIKAALTTDYFEKLIEKYLLKNTHSSLLTLKPQKGLAEKKLAELQEELERYKGKLTGIELDRILEQTMKLKERQNTPDTPEALETIPLLPLDAINAKAEVLKCEEADEQGVKVLKHNYFTNNIAYINFIFDTHSVPQELIPYIRLLSDILGKISTEKYGYTDLSNEININTGGILFSPQVYGDSRDRALYYPKLTIKSKVLAEKMPKLFEILGEIIGHSKLDDFRRLKEIIQETKSKLEMKMQDEGDIVAAKRLFSYFSEEGQCTEQLLGLSYYKFISAIEKKFDSKIEEVVKKLKTASRLIFSQEKLLLSVTCEEKDYQKLKTCLPQLLRNLDNQRVKPIQYQFRLGQFNEGLMTQGKVQFVVKGFNLVKQGYVYSGHLQVLRIIAGFDYLWNKVRVQGGAYGAFAGFERNGNLFFSSYRDPNLRETLLAFDEMKDYLSSFKADEREMRKYIIGTMSRIDKPLTPAMKGERAVENYIRGISIDDINKEREEVLETKEADIRALAKMVADAMGQNYYCVFGSESKIKDNKELFKSLIKVFE